MPFGRNFRNLTFGEPSSGFTSGPRSTSTSHGHFDTQDSPRPGLGGSHHLPPYSILCSSRRRLHPNGTFCWDSQNGVCRTPTLAKCGVKPNTCKVGDLESYGTLECSELDNKAQNTLHWGVFGVIGKVLKRRYRKWPRIGHLDICSQVMGKRKAGSQIDNLTPDH